MKIPAEGRVFYCRLSANKNKSMKPQTAERLEQLEQYYFAEKLAEIERRRKNGQPVINLAIGNPGSSPKQETLQNLSNLVLEESMHGYQSYKGNADFREAWAGWYWRHFGVTLEPENEILATMGSREAIMLITMAFVNKGDKVLVPDPGYPIYRSATRLNEAEVVPYNLLPENSWLPDFTELEQLVDEKTKLMWVNFPHMPTGTTASHELMQKLSDFAKRKNILLVNDNPYSLLRNPNPVSLFTEGVTSEHLVELNSLSKSHNMAGWRIAGISGNLQVIDSILKVKSQFNAGIFLPIQKAAASAMNKDEEWIQSLNEEYRRKERLGKELLDALGCKYENDQSGMFLWATIPPEFSSSKKFVEYLLDVKDIFIAPGFIFGENGEGFIRLSLSNKEEDLRKALFQIKVSLQKVEF